MVGLDGAIPFPTETWQYAALTVCCALVFIGAFRLGHGVDWIVSGRVLRAICLAAGSASASSAVLTFTVNRLDHIPRSTPFICFILLAAGWTAIRALASQQNAMASGPAKNPHQPHLRRVALVGVDQFAALAIRLTDCQSPRTVEFVAALDPRRRLVGRAVNGVKIVGEPRDLGSVIEEYAVHGVAVDEVWVADDLVGAHREWRTSVGETCETKGVKCCTLAEALNLSSVRSPALARRVPAASVSGYFTVKRVFDVAFAAALLFLLAPVTLIVAVVVAVDVGTPIIFWQERIGFKGRKFLLYKFRTYLAPFDSDGRPIREEERLSWLGNLLRKSRLDEIPQLFNVLRGDMSLIGPRPLLPVDQPADPLMRLSVRPGLTGWAQVNGGTLVTAEEKDALDSWYVRHASIGLDLRIALHTVRYFSRGERKERNSIEEAMRWRRTAERGDGTVFPGRGVLDRQVSEEADAIGGLRQAEGASL